MGRLHTIEHAPAPVRAVTPVLRTLDVVVSAVGLILCVPLLGLLALAVRASSHGRVLHREPAFDRNGRRVQLLSFRTMLDGGATDSHQRLRSVIGAGDDEPLTPVGRMLRRTRLEHLPRLINVISGSASLFG